MMFIGGRDMVSKFEDDDRIPSFAVGVLVVMGFLAGAAMTWMYFTSQVPETFLTIRQDHMMNFSHDIRSAIAPCPQGAWIESPISKRSGFLVFCARNGTDDGYYRPAMIHVER
jgi:hypothetical protein